VRVFDAFRSAEAVGRERPALPAWRPRRRKQIAQDPSDQGNNAKVIFPDGSIFLETSSLSPPVVAGALERCMPGEASRPRSGGPDWKDDRKPRSQKESTMATASLNVNDRTISVTVDDPDTPLLYVLRNELGLHGPRFGCGLGQCGACTVHVDGAAVRSCITPLSSVTGRIVTLEGLGTDAAPHPLQQAFVEEQAVQCGYCINGMIMQAAALLGRNPKPSEDAVKAELANNLCRCGTHLRIVRAVLRAADA
jgi:nicotinate dehydrogenase subunit A